MRRLLLSAALLALVVAVGCGPTGSTGQQAAPPSGAYGGGQQQPKPTDGRADGPKKDDGK